MTTSYIATTLNTIMIVLRYIGPPLTNQTIVQGFTRNNDLFPGSQPAVDVTKQFSAKKPILKFLTIRAVFADWGPYDINILQCVCVWRGMRQISRISTHCRSLYLHLCSSVFYFHCFAAGDLDWSLRAGCYHSRWLQSGEICP